MTKFHFSLEKALELRRLQLELAESAFQREAAALAGLDRERADMRTSRANAEADVRAAGSSYGCDLAALGAFQMHVQGKEKALAQRRIEFEKKLQEQRDAMLEARRRCTLLEKLKERRRVDWNVALNRELEELASESYLAQWNRRQA
jgi:flagellar biosynthesis chaperone FliJ